MGNIVLAPTGRGERHSTSSPEMSSCDRACAAHGSLETRSQVINTTGLRNDYPFLSGLQAQEIRLGSPDRFPHERCGLGTRLDVHKDLVN